MTAHSRKARLLSLAAALRGVPLDASRWQPEELAAAAEEHGITALLWESLHAADGAPRALRAALEASVQRSVARDLLTQREIRAVVTALGAAKVPALLVKGSALAFTVYPKPYLRPRLDTDVLVRTTDFDRAAAVLTGCGYSAASSVDSNRLLTHQVVFERRDALTVYHAVDLHWKLVNPHAVADAIPFELLWKLSEAAPALGAAARVPSLSASVVLACVHRVVHHQRRERLIWLYDLKLLTDCFSDTDWVALRSMACSSGVASLCLGGLRRAREWLGASLPLEVETALAAAARGEKSIAYVAGRVRNRDVLISDLNVLSSWRGRLQLLREHVFPPARFMRQRYATSAPWPLPALYLHRFLTAIVKWTRE